MKSSLKTVLLILSIVAVILIYSFKIDRDYWATILLPVIYGLGVFLLFKPDLYKYGPCSICLMCFYAFRMCVLPVICAWGGFFMEISQSYYIAYYTWGILLMCLEFLVIIYSNNYYCKKYLNRREITTQEFNHRLLNRTSFVIAFIMIGGLIFVAPDYFHFLLDEIDVDLDFEETEHKGIWYVLDLVCNLGRPLLSIVILSYGLKKKNIVGAFISIGVIALNFLFMSDHRIYSLLISGVCLYYVLHTVKSKFLSTTLLAFLVVGAVFTVYVCFFYQIGEGKEFISRTFDHYFSGPSLTAIGLSANNRVDYSLTDFFKLLFNDFHVLNVLFGKFQVQNAYENIFDYSHGIWTPMFVGGIRYFGPFAIIFLVLFVKFICFCDHKIKTVDDQVFQVLYVFMGANLACNMIMYKFELLLYYMLSTVLLYNCLIYFSRGRENLSYSYSDHLESSFS